MYNDANTNVQQWCQYMYNNDANTNVQQWCPILMYNNDAQY
jgi:hypothetical protein